MIGVVATLKIAEGKEAEFETVAKDLMAKVKANEPGTLTYQLYKSKKDANTYIFMEQYATQADLDAHGKTEYFTAAGPKLGPCLAGVPEIQVFDIVE
ncbi:MAG: putative quinol monooxygenase [Henriciella sp.]|nr:putative quinol monooxygenase [Henriciella sp.]